MRRLFETLSIVLFCTLLMIGGPVWAQEVQGEDQPLTDEEAQETAVEEALKESPFEGEVTVTATRRETDVQSTAAAITAVSGETLEAQGKKTVTEFISAVPGVTVSESGAGENRIIFRNIATSTQQSGSATSATYFDDFPISTSDSSPPIRLVDIDRVEVLKGPQGTLFGRSAMSGIVRYIPNKPNTEKFSAGFNTYVSDTTDGGTNFGVQGYANIPLTDNLAMRVVGYSYQDDGFIDNLELELPDFNTDDTNGGRFALGWQPNERFSLDLTYLNQSTDASFPRVTTTRDPGDRDVVGDEGPNIPYDIDARTMISGVRDAFDTSYEFLNLKLNYEFDSFSATFLATRTENDSYTIDDDREWVGLRAGAVALVNEWTPETDIFEFRLVSSSDGFLDWIAGIYYEDAEGDLLITDIYYGPDQLLFGFYPLTDGDVAVYQRSKNTGHEEAAYGEVGLNFSEDTRLLLGYRYSNVEYGKTYYEASGFFDYWQGFDQLVGPPFETDENVSTYKVSFEHSFNEDFFGYALASSGYRRGGFNEPTVISEFSTYDSDTLWNYELGIKNTWLNGLLRTNIAAYYLDYDDIQLVITDWVTFARTTQNAGKAGVTGVEFGLDYFVTENLRFTFGGSLSTSELREDIPPDFDPATGEPVYTGRKGDRLPGSAEESFSVMFDWKQPIGNGMDVFANGMYRYVGDRLNDFNLDLDVALPSYSLTDVRVGISHPSGWSAALFADNVFDEKIEYRILRTGMDFDYVPTNRPRTVGVNFIYNF